MADVSDLKSEARMSVWVRVPPPAPYRLQELRSPSSGTSAGAFCGTPPDREMEQILTNPTRRVLATIASGWLWL